MGRERARALSKADTEGRQVKYPERERGGEEVGRVPLLAANNTETPCYPTGGAKQSKINAIEIAYVVERFRSIDTSLQDFPESLMSLSVVLYISVVLER